MVTSSSAAHWSWVGAALVLAVAVGCWPARPERHRLAAVLPTDGRGIRSSVRGLLRRSARVRSSAALQLTATALLGLALAGPAGALAGSMLGGLWLHRRRVAARQRHTEAELNALADALGVMTTELRTGAHPANAAADAAASGAAAVHRVLASVATGARLGADVPALLGRYAATEPTLPEEIERLAGAWALAERHGVALAELLDAVRADLDARIRLTGQVTAQLAGPKASAAVLAGLPLLGIALGQGIGADPWHVLTATPVGQLLLVVGTALACAGVTWSGRIMSKAVPE